MLPVFTTKATVQRPSLIHPRWEYISRMLRATYTNAQAYRHEHLLGATLRNTFLMRLLLNYPLHFNQPLDAFYNQAYWDGLNFSQTLGMTSTLNLGQAHAHNFFNDGSVELYLATFDQVDLKAVATDWQNIQAVSYLMHPRSSLCAAPEGEQRGEAGLVVVAVNMPLLAVQLKLFLDEQAATRSDDKNISAFIDQYVVPNAFASQADVAVFNQIDYLSQARPVIGSSQAAKTPYPNVNLDSDVSQIVKDTLGEYQYASGSFDELMQNTPAIFNKNSREAFILPDVVINPNTMWLLVVARLRVYDTMLRIGGEKTIRANQHDINALNRIIRSYNVYGLIKKMIPDPHRAELLAMVERLQALV